MNAVWEKIKADLFRHRIVSGLIVGTITVAAALLTLALSTLLNLGGPYDRLFAEMNGAHLWVFFKPGMVNTADLHRIQSLPGVIDSTPRQYSYLTQARIHDARVWVTLRVVPDEQPAINRLYFLDGRTLAPDAKEVIAEKALDVAHDLTVGEAVVITNSEGRDVSLPIVGLAYDVMYDTYRSEQSPYLYVSEGTLRNLFPDKDTWSSSLGLRLSDPNAVDEVFASIESMRATKFIESHTDWRDVKESAIFSGQLASVFLSAFSFFAILATVIIIVSVVSSTILSQIKQIGILKALGFTSGQILLVYVGQYAVLSLIGTTLGFLLGVTLAPVPMRAVIASLNTTFRPPFSFSLFLLVFLIISSATMLSALSAAARGARANIIKSIAIGAEAPNKRMFWGARVANTLGAPVSIVMGLNDMFVKPFRSFLTGLNLVLGVIGIVFGLALSDTLRTYRENPALLGIVYDATVTRQQVSDNFTRRQLTQAPGVEAFYGELQVKAWTSDESTLKVRAVDGELDRFPFQILEGRFFQPGTNEAVAGKGLLTWLGLEVGDSLTLHLEEKDGPAATWTIVGVYPEPGDAGQRLMVDLSSLSRLVKNDEPATYYLKLSPTADVPAIREFLSPHKDSGLSLATVGEAIPDSVIYLQVAIFALAGILIVIALVNVLIMSLLVAQEKMRTIGILKTVGMTPSQVIAMFNTTAASLGALAVVVGIPTGLWVTRDLLTVMSDSFGFGKISVSLDPTQAVILVPFIVIVSAFGSYLPARWAANLFIVQVLRKE
ncbi:MAG: FtsX-like permease family protein [Chloroflexi bacterium]|nr:FtsX-like permease family protein [Chloroflexota bacterium]